MYGLKQASVLSYDNVVYNISPSGYWPTPNTIGTCKNDTT